MAWTKILRRERAPIDVDLLAILEPQPSQAARTSEAADGIHVPRILHPERQWRQPPEVWTLDSASHASAQDAHEVGADLAAMLEIRTLRHGGPPRARARRDSDDGDSFLAE
jgi:hypothetical protein